MRHCTIDLTMSRYSHVFAGQEADAVAALPDLGLPLAGAAKATGTDGRAAGGNDDGDDGPRRPPRRPRGRRGAPAGGERGGSASEEKTGPVRRGSPQAAHLARFLALGGGFRGISTDFAGPKTGEPPGAEKTGKHGENSGKAGAETERGGVAERSMAPVLKTGVPSAQPTPAEAIGENTPPDLGAFFGALARIVPDAPDLTDLLAAWPALPEPVKAGILAMVKASRP